MSADLIIIDTNVFVSGLRSNRGMSYQLLVHLGTDLFKTVVTVPIILEYEKVLTDSKTKIPLTAPDIEKFLNYLCKISDCRKVHFLWRPFLRDAGDDMVLEAAVSGQCKYIITFNTKDFKGSEKFGVIAMTPGEFLKQKGVLK
jgi:putative PIN family toxin of toxin-antitoxin system